MYLVPDQGDKRFVVTGANAGTGKEAARRIAAAGGSVVMAVRSPSKGEAARAEILRDHPEASLEVRALDLADLASVTTFSERLLEDDAPVDVLVHSAGVLMPPPKRQVTADGFELQLGTNVLGPYVLTALLLPRILESPTPRVTTKTSLMARFGKIRFDDLDASRSYRARAAYAQSKLATMLIGLRVAELAAELDLPLLSTLAHTGFTRSGGESRKRRRNGSFVPPMDVDQGAEGLIFAAVDPAVEQGAYYGPGGIAGLAGPVKRLPLPRNAKRDPSLPASLCKEAERLTGVELPLGR
jgi:NAD(P)-dependent dehydrogenase (short-subunit alcohol dehydrogenase family)